MQLNVPETIPTQSSAANCLDILEKNIDCAARNAINTVSATTVTAPSVNSYLTLTSNGKVLAVIKVTKSNQNYRVLAYNNSSYPSTTVTSSTNTSYDLTNGLYYIAK